MAPKTGTQGTFQALIDSGCTRCLINLPTVLKLGIRVKKLNHPIQFEQVDGSLVEETYATHLTEPVKLELADHWETIRFIIAPKMTDPVILGLSWLDKWGPIIWWQEGTRRLMIAKGPQPLPLQPGETPHTRAPIPPATAREDATDTKVPPYKGTPEKLAAASDSSYETEQIPEEYQDLAEVFSEAECDILPPHREADCAIKIIPGAKLPKPKLYAMTPREMQEMWNYIDKNLQRGFIERAKPRIAAPVLFKEKKDGSMCLVVDFRDINAVCVHNLYPLPLMKDMLAHLAKGKVFTKLDLREAYYRIRIREADEWKTAFNCPLGSFQFKVMPFGLQGALAVFMQLINEVLHEHLYKGVLVYLDDILIYTETIDQRFSTWGLRPLWGSKGHFTGVAKALSRPPPCLHSPSLSALLDRWPFVYPAHSQCIAASGVPADG
ncbi:retrotransposon-derived protein PEG10 isoform X5 [Pantherophis guttatus]|uniref:ribonuclease H n=1 Tax=Pantherophis guttatus TaxID=94885 RepID=A0ABM3Z9G8_PANGU|nr:retrotransposon-derived protein PEG10 isoform X5 [Pantherophis guttatus]